MGERIARIGATIASLLGFQPQHACNDTGNTFPVLGRSRELAAPDPGDGIEFRLAVVLGGAPLGADPTLLREAQKRGVDRAFIQFEQLLAKLLDPSRYAIAVQRT